MAAIRRHYCFTKRCISFLCCACAMLSCAAPFLAHSFRYACDFFMLHRVKKYAAGTRFVPFFAFDVVTISLSLLASSCLCCWWCCRCCHRRHHHCCRCHLWMHWFKNEWLKDIDKRSTRSSTTMTTPPPSPPLLFGFFFSLLFIPFIFRPGLFRF